MNRPLTQATLQVAAQMAATGDYGTATTLLEHCTSTTASHLLRAQIAAQQGNYEEAIKHWQEVLSMTPDHAEAQAGIALAQQLAARRAKRFYLRANLYYLVLLLVIAGLLVLLWWALRRPLSNSDSSTVKSLVEANERQLQANRDVIEMLRPTTTSSGQNTSSSGELKFNLPGITSRSDGREQILTFDSGLFTTGIEFKPEAQNLLAALGRQLAPQAGQVAVYVIGHTDDLPVPDGQAYRDNAGLALARAVAVVEYLREASHLPASMFTVRGLGEAGAPYPNDAPDGRNRNRTVVLRIEPIKK